MTRATRATNCLRTARAAQTDPTLNSIQRLQAIDTWIHFATASEIRQNWRQDFGDLPAWAVR